MITLLQLILLIIGLIVAIISVKTENIFGITLGVFLIGIAVGMAVIQIVY